MFVYTVLRVYSNGISVMDGTYSSKKKAQTELDWRLRWCEKDGWSVNQVIDLHFKHGAGVKITPPSGDQRQTECYFIVKQEVK
mgnify:FL=1